MIKTVFIFEWKKISATAPFLAGVFMLLFVSIYALFNGKSIIKQQSGNISLAIERENTIFNGIVERIRHPDTTTTEAKWGYSHLKDAGWTITSPNKRWTSYWKPSSASFLSVGNRDIYPYYHELEPYSFYMRFFKNEISSPLKLLYGNFDLAFVIILLFPIFLIAFSFDAYAVEEESGTLSLLHTSGKPVRLIFYKLLFYFLLTLLLLNLIMVTALIISSGLGTQQWGAFVLVANCYLLSWFILIYLITRLRFTSVISAILLITCWIFLCVGLPATFNAIANIRYPVNTEMFSKYIRRVQMSDDPTVKRKLLNKFYSFYPQYAHTDTSGPSYSNKLYTAYGNLNDRRADPLLSKYFLQMEQREEFLTRCNFFNPATICQQYFNQIAESDLKSYILYVRNVRNYVQIIKEDLTQKCFDQIPLTVEELEHRFTFERFIHSQNQ
ncbi:DUF3526 domain-containing protein [Mucilaginibacter sp. UYCu711]|uniref:DUF3526 domain-containing protein n=1 Tax=Mucilaginibacter sp. UYCu711 TaxID=3156339 RepID=UPI003D262219